MAPYTSRKPAIAESSESLRARIPGWGVDLDPQDRPSVPKLLPPGEGSRGAGADAGQVPDRQPERWPRERSVEHALLTPVFGTSCPPRGLSGRIRRLSYARYSEARAAHWLLLLLADRVDSKEHIVRSLLTLRPDNPVTQTGVRSELTHGGLGSRWRRGRVDVAHHALDPVVVGGPWLLGVGLGLRLAVSLGRRGRRRWAGTASS